MQGTEFLQIIKKFENVNSLYFGCYSADNIPKKLNILNFAIVNTDKTAGLGKHWYCIFKSSPSKLEVFDSLGIDSDKKDFLSKNGKMKGIKEIEFNTTVFQSDTSSSCGKYVLYFIFERLYNQDLSFKDLLEEIFVEDTSINESKVEKFFSELTKNGVI